MEQSLKPMNSIETTSEESEIIKTKEASFRISAFILTKAWLKRCQKSNELNTDLVEFSEKCESSREKLESKKSRYFYKEQENEDLTCQLRMTQNEMEELMLSIDELATNINTLEAKKNELLSQFNNRCKECIDTNMHISELKLKLMEVLEKNEELETQIETEKTRAERVIKEGDKLNDEFTQIKTKCAQKERILIQQIEEVENEIQRSKNEKTELKHKLLEMKKYTEMCESCRPTSSDAAIEMEKKLLCQQAAVLREALEQTIDNRLRKNGLAFLSMIAEVLKIILPAFPILKTKLLK